MTNEQLRSEVERLRDQLVGVRLLAAEMTDEVSTLRQIVTATRVRWRIEADASLSRLDSLIEPLHQQQGSKS
jgi:hypothetical protein